MRVQRHPLLTYILKLIVVLQFEQILEDKKKAEEAELLQEDKQDSDDSEDGEEDYSV